MAGPDSNKGREATQAPAAEIVSAFLMAMERRDLAAARQMLCDDFLMTFPGNMQFRMIEDMVAWAQSRYRFVTKTITDMDVLARPGHSIVYCHGTLAGQWLDGSPFEGVRFIDRFVVRDGLLIDQAVWNDLAVARV